MKFYHDFSCLHGIESSWKKPLLRTLRDPSKTGGTPIHKKRFLRKVSQRQISRAAWNHKSFSSRCIRNEIFMKNDCFCILMKNYLPARRWICLKSCQMKGLRTLSASKDIQIKMKTVFSANFYYCHYHDYWDKTRLRKRSFSGTLVL